MGSRNLDRISVAERRNQAETVADMWKRRWRIRVQCEACGVELTVNLLNLIKLNGPDLSLWFKSTRCRRIVGIGERCSGRMFFKALPPGASGYEFLGIAPRTRRPPAGPLSTGRGPFIEPTDIEPPAALAARGPSPPDLE